MFSLNRVQLIGYQTQPVELRQTPSGQSVADLNVATPYAFTTDSGQALSGTGYHSVTVWGGMADVAAQYLKVGAQVFLSGRLQTDSWEDEKSGEKRSKTRIVALDMILLDPKGGQLEAGDAPKHLTSCLNRADIVGHLTRDPEIRTTTNGNNVATLGIATNERWKDKASGEIKERVEFHNLVLWNELAELASKHLKKGMRAHAAGRVQSRSFETKQGQKRVVTEIITDSIAMLGVKNLDVNYSTEPRRPSSSQKDGATPVGVSADVPEVQYESDVKVEDLPF
jgi:single-strand DNA-binding protein